MHASGFTPADVAVAERQTAYQGFYRLETVSLRHRLFAGGAGPLIKREVLIRPPAAGVLIFDPVRDTVLLIEQFRIGALHTAQPWQMEVVAGLLEPGESPEELVRREAQEEAGVTLRRVEPLMEFLTSPGGSTETFALLVGEADLSAAGGLHGLAEEGEDIRVHILGVAEALALRATNATLILALQWLRIHHHDLRRRWGI